MMYPLAGYYALAALMYLAFGAMYGAKVQWAIGIGPGLYPVMHSKPRTVTSMAVQLLAIGGAASALSASLALHWWVGPAACLAVSLYEVWLSWTFYRDTASDYMQLARLTFNAASAAWCGGWLMG